MQPLPRAIPIWLSAISICKNERKTPTAGFQFGEVEFSSAPPTLRACEKFLPKVSVPVLLLRSPHARARVSLKNLYLR